MKPVYISGRYLELLGQRMREAGIKELQINESDWINVVKDAIEVTEYRAGILLELEAEELKLIKRRAVR